MKCTYFIGLAIISLTSVLAEQEKPYVEDPFLNSNSIKNGIEFDDSIGELVYSIANNADAILAMDTEARGSDTPISIGSIIRHIFVDNEQPNLIMDNAFHVSKDNLIRELTQDKNETTTLVEKQEVTISKEDQMMLSDIHDDLLVALDNYTNDSINEIQHAIVWMTDRSNTSTILMFYDKMRTIYDTAFMGYGSGNSLVERIVYTLEASVSQFNKDMLIMKNDDGNDTIQELINDQVETVLASLRLEIRPLVEQYMSLQNAQEEEDKEDLDNTSSLNDLVENTVQTIMMLPEIVIDNIIHIFTDILHKNDPEGKVLQEDAIRLHLVRTLDQVVDSYFGSIKKRIHASNLMIQVLAHAADTYNILKTHLTTLVKENMNDVDSGLYALLNDHVQRQKFVIALIRNIKPLTVNVTTSVSTFVTDHLDTLYDTSFIRAFSSNLSNFFFDLLNDWVMDIMEENFILGIALKILLIFVESIFDDGFLGIPALLPSLEKYHL